MKYPHCHRLNLLRELGTQTVVSSAALYDHLGNAKYQKFIAWNNERKRPQTGTHATGFHPATVEQFLAKPL